MTYQVQFLREPKAHGFLENAMKRNTNKGFTLIELLISMMVLSAIGGALISLQYFLGQNQILIYNTFKNEDEAASAVSTFVKELRNAKESDNGSHPLEMVQDSEIRFYSDINADGLTEKVRYVLTGTNLVRGVIKPTGYPVSYPPASETTKVVAEDIRNTSPVFSYYNGDWPDDTQNNPLILSQRLSLTRLVKIYLRVNKKANDPGKDYILESVAQIRMLKDNL